jgi:hypothetical protein
VEALERTLGRAGRVTRRRFKWVSRLNGVPSRHWAAGGTEVSVYHMPRSRNLAADSLETPFHPDSEA